MSLPIIKKPTAHFDQRASGAVPRFLILHYTETVGAQPAEDYFLGTVPHPTGGRVSVHYMIDEAGAITQYVDEDKRAWHAGLSYWDGTTDLNSHSIGIELVNPGHKHGYRAFPPVQMAALRQLARDIIARHGISPHHVLAHSDIAPMRKIDPGELFDWQALAGAGIGVWPDQLSPEDYKMAERYSNDRQSLKEAFTKVGYDPNADLDKTITAFQRHFNPEAFCPPQSPGTPNKLMGARLHWLVRHRPAL